MKTAKFIYTNPRRIKGWGYRFDSLTELKYVVSITDEYEFLREPVVIYYNPGNRMPVDNPKSNYRPYTPDFLIRHKQTREAFLVEIKPRAFQGQPQLALRKEVAENYIRWKKYDWEYKVVFDNGIVLSAEQLEDFEDCCRLKTKTDLNNWFEQYSKKYGHAARSLINGTSDNRKVQFVMFGTPQQLCFPF